ncbi:MAG: Rpn family recombination-promoting nuclease/putative transposase [Leptospiraceae bacterium]|nr:Rpn family recombination-promoting nuclease/putative transposase [Leptospiraceae bacterium]
MKQKDTEKQNGLLPLHNDIVFKIFCIKYPHLLADLLNSVLGFEGNQKITRLKILNPEIPGDLMSDKLSVLDIHAKNKNKQYFGIEMQAFPQKFYGKRILYYWAKLYSQQIVRGKKYSDLKPVYSVSFLNFKLLETENYHSIFRVLETSGREIALTKDLEIHILELKKFLNTSGTQESNLEDWIYLIQKAEKLKEEDVKELKIKNPVIREAVEALQDISLDRKTRNYYEMRLKTERDHEATIEYAFEEGLKKGVEQGIEKERYLTQEIEKTQRLVSIREKRAEHKKALRTAIKMKHAGSSLDFISEMTELPEAYLVNFFKKAFSY